MLLGVYERVRWSSQSFKTACRVVGECRVVNRAARIPDGPEADLEQGGCKQTGQCEDAQRSFEEALDYIRRLILIGGRFAGLMHAGVQILRAAAVLRWNGADESRLEGSQEVRQRTARGRSSAGASLSAMFSQHRPSCQFRC